ncbi:hypothetical protein ACFRAR_16650 [Kitasatospora sp. NPDC056651]|uniref:hypothetical protein n=1 Tax=Kitasatospora sp. NPDC056651 TaxID=3345892 RepID=UPI00367D00C3
MERVVVGDRPLDEWPAYLVLFENWLRRALGAFEPDEDRQLVRRFATWHGLQQLRQREAREALTPDLTACPRHEINSAHRFLAWAA